MADEPQVVGLTVLRRCGLRETWLQACQRSGEARGVGEPAPQGAAQGEGAVGVTTAKG